MKSYEEGKKVYWGIKTKERKQYDNKDSRQEIGKYKQGFADGFSSGYSSALKNNFKIIKETFGS